MTTTVTDADHMASALNLARRGLGQTWPNPAVGCVLVRDGVVIGRGWTQPGGRPHAETEALRRAGAEARGATAYVTLEPCAHHGRTGPCAEALIAAGVARVVSAIEDPDPRVAGQGHAALRAAGIVVETGLMAEAAARLNQGFLSRVTRGRPRVLLKLATSLDGRIATRSGESRWITGAQARARVHLGRAMTDAILIGSGTALMDDPDLTCRLDGLEHRSPLRVVADGRLRLPLTARLVRDAALTPTLVVTLPDAEPHRRRALEDCGVILNDGRADADNQLDPASVLAVLAERGVTRVLLEGGARLAASFLRAGLVDAIAWYRAPIILGGDGVPALAALGLDRLAAAPRLVRRGVETLGQDLLETYDVLP